MPKNETQHAAYELLKPSSEGVKYTPPNPSPPLRISVTLATTAGGYPLVFISSTSASALLRSPIAKYVRVICSYELGSRPYNPFFSVASESNTFLASSRLPATVHP